MERWRPLERQLGGSEVERFTVELARDNQVRSAVEAAGKTFEQERRNIYVSPVLAQELIDASATFGDNAAAVSATLQTQFPMVDDIGNDDMLDAFVVNGVYTLVLKAAVRRERPNEQDNKAFPSGHTSNAFALAAVAERHYGWKAGVPAYLLASAVGVSRLQRNKHHLSDVVAGAALGYIVGRTVVRVAHLHQDRRNRWVDRLEQRRGRNISAVAVANKNARIAWVLLSQHVSYQAMSA